MLRENPPSAPLDSSSRWEEQQTAGKTKGREALCSLLAEIKRRQGRVRLATLRKQCKNKTSLLQINDTIKWISLTI